MTPRIEPALLAGFHAGGPLLLAAATLPDAAALELPGLVLWLVDDEGRMYRPGGDPARATRPLAAAPGEVVALVGAAAGLEAFGAWWRDNAPGPLPPLLAVADGAAALPALAPLLAAALAARSTAAAVLQRALVAARQEAQQLQEAMQALLRHAGPAVSPPPPDLVRPATADPAQRLAPRGGRLAVGQSLGIKAAALTALALHLETAAAGRLTTLRVRLHGAESGRILGAWQVGGEALAPGWLQLDLAQPLGPLRETALLEVVAEVAAGDALRLSLEDREGPLPAVLAGGPAQERALAVRAWSAPHGRRFVQPLHWDEAAIGLPLAPAGVRVELPDSVLAHARLPLGHVEARALGGEAPRLLATLPGGAAALVVMPAVPLAGLDLLTAELDLLLGDATLLEAALWLQPAEAVVAGLADLSPEPPGACWSGWRSPLPGEPLPVTLALPLAAPERAMVVVALRNTAAQGEPAVQVELAALFGRRVAQPVGGKPEARTRLAAARPGTPLLAAARLHDSLVLGGGNYRHLDIWLDGVRAGTETWPRLRFKFVLADGNPVLEFRARPDWPPLFEQWPEGTAAMRSDQYGPYLWLTEAALAEGLAARLARPRDRAMLAALVALLPTAVATVARDATAEPAEFDLLIGKARRFTAAWPG